MSTQSPLCVAALLILATLLAQPARAQTPAPGEPRPDLPAAAVANAARTVEVAAQPATLVYSNRTIVELRATVLSRPPAARAAAAVGALERITRELPSGRATMRAYPEGIVVGIDARPVFVIFAADVDPLAGEALETKAADAVARLQTAFDEGVELRSPTRLARSGGIALGATILYAAVLWFLIRIDRRLAARVSRTAERQLLRLPGGEAIAQVADARTNVHRAFTVISVLIGLLLTYTWVTAVLRRFPYTRPWGESLRGALLSMAGAAGRLVIDALPNVLTVVLIVVVTRGLIRLGNVAFRAIEEGRISVPWIHPETAQPTRRIAVALLWLGALMASYQYLPGSQSEVFKGVSVFIGLIVSLGSSGVMNQMMSGLMVTYSRALRNGDFVKVGDIEGTVTAVGLLATKIKTIRNEEITVPNAIVVSHATTNFTRNQADGVYTATSVTIGYDAPWRQVEALLLLAAARTPGVRREPKPKVLQTSLQDFYVEYTLLIALEQPHVRGLTLDALHSEIQDAFNEYGVQIMSPHYEADPNAPKVVPPKRWHSAPAVPADGAAPSAPQAAEDGRLQGV